MPSLRSNRVVLPDGTRPATITHDHGRIVDIGHGPADDDYGDLVVLPGLVDTHVHVNEPGRTEWEGFETATLAAAAGGTTTIVDMPLNSIPPTIDQTALELKRNAARGQIEVDVAFWGGVIPGSLASVPGLVAAGACGFKAFLVDSGVEEFPPIGIEDLGLLLDTVSALGVPALVHAEDPALLDTIEGNPRSYSSYLRSRPVESETEAVRAVVAAGTDRSAMTHILHVSSGEAAEIIAAGGANSTGETCPHYLTFAAEEIPDGATAFKCAPPIRARPHREALWEALRDGSLTLVVSDHSPAPADIKELASGDFAAAWGGIASLELRLPATWTRAVERGFGFEDLGRWMASAPAELAGLSNRKGSLEEGKDADFAVFDPDTRFRVSGSRLRHRHPVCPYEGMTLRGRVVDTILRGQTVFADGEPTVIGDGRLMGRNDRPGI